MDTNESEAGDFKDSGDSEKMEVQEERVPLQYIPDPKISVDISPEHNKLLFKEKIKEGEDNKEEGSEGMVHGLGACMGMEVKVHYVGTLPDGKEFDRSNRASEPFSFVLGEEKVIKAWEIGVLGMRKGEICRLICHPELAYGKVAQGKIPANSTLIFEIEMIDFLPEDLSKHKNKTLLRYKTTPGIRRFVHPNHGSQVEIYIEGRTNEQLIFNGHKIQFKLGEGSLQGVPYGVEKALYKFNENECSYLMISKKYGPAQEIYQIGNYPPDTVFEFYVELKSFENPKEPWQMEGPEKLEYAKEFKVKGGKFFSDRNYRLALDYYKRIVDFLKAEALLVDENEENRKALLLASYLNQALCNLKLNRNPQAIRNCDDALDMDKNNLKGLYRRGLARLAVSEPIEAKEDFMLVLNIEPDNKAAQQQIKMCEIKIAEHQKKEKQIFQKMFSSLGKPEKSDDKPLPNGMENVSEWEKPGQASNGN